MKTTFEKFFYQEINYNILFSLLILIMIITSLFYNHLNLNVIGIILFVLISLIAILFGFKISLFVSFLSIIYLFFISFRLGEFQIELIHASFGYLLISFIIGNLSNIIKEKENSLVSEIKRRKNLEKKLRQNKNYLESIFKAIPETIIHYNLNGDILHVWFISDNSFFTKEDLIGKNLSDISEDIKEKLLDSCDEILNNNSIISKKIFLKKNNEEKHFVARLSCVNNEDNEKEIIASIRDMTSRFKIEKDLNKKRALLNQLFSSNFDAIVLLDNEDNVLRVNKSFENLFEYDKSEILGKKINDLIVPNNKLNEANNLSKKVINGESIFKETKRVTKNGEFIDVSITAVPINVNGRQIGLYGVYRDISKRKKLERNMEWKSSLLHALLSNFPDPVYFKDTNLNFILANDKTAKSLKLSSKEDLIGKSDEDFLPKEDAKLSRTQEEYVMEKQEPLKIEKKVDDEKWVLMTKVPFIDSNCELKGILGINYDISGRKKAEIKLKEEKDRIEYLSFHDELTGLYNRRFFQEEINRLEKSRLNPIAIIVADLDGLKKVNDEYGHDKGDEYIINAANVLKEVSRDGDILARLGGDEFSIILPETDDNGAKSFCKRAKKYCKNKGVSISIGYAIRYNDKSLEKIFNIADQRMYDEKRVKKNSRC